MATFHFSIILIIAHTGSNFLFNRNRLSLGNETNKIHVRYGEPHPK